MVRLGFFVKLVERSLFAPDGDERGDGYLSAGSLASLGHAAVMYDWTSSTPLKEGYICVCKYSRRPRYTRTLRYSR